MAAVVGSLGQSAWFARVLMCDCESIWVTDGGDKRQCSCLVGSFLLGVTFDRFAGEELAVLVLTMARAAISG